MRLTVLFIFFFSLLVAACGAERQPDILIVPTATPTLFIPSVTPTPSPTIYQSPTATHEPPTLFPTLPPRDPVLQGSNPIRPTFTQAPATLTATFLPTLAGISIEYFVTNASRIFPGDIVTLFWRVNGVSSARIYRLDNQGRRVKFWDVGSEGELAVSTPADAIDKARFLLRAGSDASLVQKELAIQVLDATPTPTPSICPYAWLFIPAPAGCPDSEAVSSLHVEQHFEGGWMIWVEATHEIFVLFNDGQKPAWLRVPDTFQEGMPIQDDTIVPPPDRFQPIRGFGLVWRENTTIRDRLRWGLMAEAAYQGVFQSGGVGSESAISIRTLDGNIAILEPGAALWQALPFQEPEIMQESPTPTAAN